MAGYIIIEERPSYTKIKKRYINSLIDIVSEHDSEYSKLSYDAKKLVFDKLLHNNKTLNNFENKYKDKNQFIDIKEEYVNDLKELNKNQIHFIIKVVIIFLMIWFIPICLIYILGLSVRWIIKGFK